MAIGVLTITAISWSTGRLDVRCLQRLGADGGKKRRGVQSTSADFHVVRLQKDAAVICPIGLQSQDQGLKILAVLGVIPHRQIQREPKN